MSWRIHRECGSIWLELGRLWLIRCAGGPRPGSPGHPNRWMIVWRRGLPEWDPKTKWEGSDEPGRYWRHCEARLQRKRGVDPEDAVCQFPNCDELGCLRHLSEQKRDELKRLDAERKAESKRYREKWTRLYAEREAERQSATNKDAKENPHDVAARLPALEKIMRDLEYRLPGSGKPLGHVVLTREQAAALRDGCAGRSSRGAASQPSMHSSSRCQNSWPRLSPCSRPRIGTFLPCSCPVYPMTIGKHSNATKTSDAQGVRKSADDYPSPNATQN
jgi:hypothetical protein